MIKMANNEAAKLSIILGLLSIVLITIANWTSKFRVNIIEYTYNDKASEVISHK